MTHIKNCSNCAHRQPANTKSGFDSCMVSGFFVPVERMFNNKCDENFSRWESITPLPPPPPSLWQLFIAKLRRSLEQ